MRGKFDDSWIGVDWGTSRLRAWRMDGLEVAAEASSDQGVSTLSKSEMESAFLALASPWIGNEPEQIVVCGMAGSRQGWHEAPYRAVPCPPLGLPDSQVPTSDPRLHVSILPGLKQMRPHDVMRGEETQIAGFLSETPGFDGVLCLPGTHTKWAQISAGEVVSFRTFMTGEMFALLGKASVLRHNVGTGWDDISFLAAVDEALTHPASVGARLFGLRAEALLSELDPATARSRLSGLLIGMELAGAKPYWLGQRIAVIGAEEQARAYADALAAQGLVPERADGDRMTRTGLATARALLKEPAS